MCTDKGKQYAFVHLTTFLARIHLDSRYWLSCKSKSKSDSRIRAGFASMSRDISVMHKQITLKTKVKNK